MNVASLKLCKELYELSGWRNTDKFHNLNHKKEWVVKENSHHDYNSVLESLENGYKVFKPDMVYPAYDLGYLLRKLPINFSMSHFGKEWRASLAETISYYGITPESAACKLAIELFKQGILTK